jgi:chromosome segregation ATPase
MVINISRILDFVIFGVIIVFLVFLYRLLSSSQGKITEIYEINKKIEELSNKEESLRREIREISEMLRVLRTQETSLLEEVKKVAEKQSTTLNLQDLDQKIALLDRKITRILEIIMSR